MKIIKKTLPHTQKCTFAVIIPHPVPQFKSLPSPNGSGFFISPDGYFITAEHVIRGVNQDKISLLRPNPYGSDDAVGNIKIEKTWSQFDLALLKVDLKENKNKDFLKDKKGFDFLKIEFSVPDEGTPVYSFGYPLPKIEVFGNSAFMAAFQSYYPRTTSLVISSHYNVIASMRGRRTFPKYYVVDKALNYGNSGGPIVLQESGKVISVCIEFQPVDIPQSKDSKITIPSLYGITSSLKNIEVELRKIINKR